MSLPGVNETIVDGGMGIIPPNAEIQGIVGNADTGTPDVIYIIGSPTEAKNAFGQGSLLDKIRDIFSVPNAPSKVYAVKADPFGGSAANAGTVIKVGTGTATTAVAGTPKCDRRYKLLVTVGGELADGKYKLSEDNGLTYGAEKNFPASGVAITLSSGSTITFTAATGTDLVAGDYCTWTVVGAKATNGMLLTALEKLTADASVGRVYVSEGVPKSFGTSISTARAVLEAKHQYITFILEAMPPLVGEATATWMAAVQLDWATYYDYAVAVVAGMGHLADITGAIRIVNLGGVVCGLRSSAKVQESIAHVRRFPVSNLAAIYPDDLTLAQIEALYDDRFVMFRYWDGNGFRCVGARMMATETSDFQRLEWLEALYKAVRLVRAKSIAWVEGPADPASLIAFQEDIKQPVENMKTMGEIQDYRLTILETDVLGTGEVAAELTITPIGIMKTISLTFGLGRMSQAA